MGKPSKVLKASKRGGVRSRIKRNKKKFQISKFSIMGTNAAGLKAKKDSLVENTQLFSPSVILILVYTFILMGNHVFSGQRIQRTTKPADNESSGQRK